MPSAVDTSWRHGLQCRHRAVTLRVWGKPAMPPKERKGLHPSVPSGEHFMDVALVPHVKDQPVPAGVVPWWMATVSSTTPQIGGQMPPCVGHHLNHPATQFLTQCLCLLVGDVRQGRIFLTLVQLGPSFCLAWRTESLTLSSLPESGQARTGSRCRKRARGRQWPLR